MTLGGVTGVKWLRVQEDYGANLVAHEQSQTDLCFDANTTRVIGLRV